MVVDNCSAYNCMIQVKSIKVVFLPHTTALQTMDQDTIQYVKSKY